MGREGKAVTVIATVSRHNSEQDEEHDLLWDQLVSAIKGVVAHPAYEAINAVVV